MTAILAAPVAGRVIIGSDRALTNLTTHAKRSTGAKVLRVGPWLIGASGVYGDDWEALKKIDPPETPGEWSDILPRNPDAQVLLVRGRTIRYGEVYEGFWCWGVTRGACYTGSGGSEAHAAWIALRGYETDPEARMRAALAATARVNVTVEGPFDIMWS